jgi:putative ABC transport system substrate-binding protein
MLLRSENYGSATHGISARTFLGRGHLLIARRSLSFAGGLYVLLPSEVGFGQSVSTVRRVGYLSLLSESLSTPYRAALAQGMRELGWLDGKTIEYRSVYSDGDVNRLDALAAELIRQNVEVIVVASSPSAHAARRATTKIPIVMASSANAVGDGLVRSLAAPGGNVTGISSQNEDVLGKLVELLHEIVPSARRFAFLLNETGSSHAAFWSVAQRACAALDLVAIHVVVSAPAQLESAVDEIVRQRSQAVVVAADGVFNAERAKLQSLMQATRLPAAYGLRENVAQGGLLSFAPDLTANFRHAARFVDKILKGASPADLPVEQPTKFELVINLRTAKEIGVTIPQAVLLRADELIQ